MKAQAALLVLVLSAGTGISQEHNPHSPSPGELGEAAVPRRAVPVPNAYGLSAETIATFFPTDFAPLNSNQAFASDNKLYRYATGGSVAFYKGLDLPSGVLLTRLEAQLCDTSMTHKVLVVLASVSADAVFSYLDTFDSGVPEAPGCVTRSIPLNRTVTNSTETLAIGAFTESGTSATSFGPIRLYYRRQVSPAPATATFSDVPVGTSQHPFVEALAAAGITVGCGGGQFCPNASLTRGQMAVFLSAALGLHFPN